MLTQLAINNFGLIDKLSLDFTKGLNVLTGETGAGKSILIDALRYGLGERLDSSAVRDKKAPCSVEAVFELPKKLIEANETMSEYLDGGEPALIISRSYLPDGRTKIKINGRAVTVAQLKEIGDHLVDLHGPHDHQMLLSSANHLGILDSLCGFGGLKNGYRDKYQERLKLKKQLEEVKNSADSRIRDMELLSRQIMELERVALYQAKYDEAHELQKRMDNREKLYESAALLLEILNNEETGAAESLRKAFGPMKTLNALDEGTKGFADSLAGAQAALDGLISGLSDYAESLSFEPQEAREINSKCDAYYEILRKYGPTLDEAKVFYQKAKERHAFLENLEHNDKDISKLLDRNEKELGDIAGKISKERKKTGAGLEKTIEDELRALGISHVRFECRITKDEPGPEGSDEVIFYISPNAGEEMKPLSEIISSGEAARVMLALKKALIKVDPIPVLIFDEIDSQIGGRLGDVLGKKLRELARDRQVILITHLPQIAGYADTHFKVLKQVENKRTRTVVRLLDPAERIKEMAKMMSGEKESELSVSHAEEMLARGHGSKEK